mmetsp:Transcript_1507/g.2045  ORF Transcript_1507/g.2045 Transcript_1507/m.2045 type:complete len:104 (-) Transcript_1507:92-403(-)
MFQDIQHFQHLQMQLSHGVGFHIPRSGGHHHHHNSERDCYNHKKWDRPWAASQGDGYMRYDNQLFWDHGFQYGGSKYQNPTTTDGDAGSTDRHGFIGWGCNGA